MSDETLSSTENLREHLEPIQSMLVKRGYDHNIGEIHAAVCSLGKMHDADVISFCRGVKCRLPRWEMELKRVSDALDMMTEAGR